MKEVLIIISQENLKDGGTVMKRDIQGKITPKMATYLIEELWEIAEPKRIHLH